MATRPSKPPALAPRLKLGDEVTRHLRDAIMSGEYAAGQRIRVEELASRLDVSTMPAREALTALAIEGLLESLPRRGYRVVKLTRQEIEDVFLVHAFVAGVLAERAARVMTPETVAKMRSMHVSVQHVAKLRISLSSRAARIEEVNFEFHRLVNRVPDSPRLRWFLRAATRYVPRHYYQSIPTWTDATVADHPAIIDALERHDAKLARRLMEQHITRAGQLVVEQFDAQGFWRSGE
jgi:DNA-binding GntR family transcriptional regulator